MKLTPEIEMHPNKILYVAKEMKEKQTLYAKHFQDLEFL